MIFILVYSVLIQFNCTKLMIQSFFKGINATVATSKFVLLQADSCHKPILQLYILFCPYKLTGPKS